MKELLALSEPLYAFMRRAAIGVAPKSQSKRRRSVADVNDTDLVWVCGRPVTRTNAALSAVDPAVGQGDAVRGCLRVYNGLVPMLDEHLGRIAALAMAKGYENVETVLEIRNAVHRTLAINDVCNRSLLRIVHVRSGVIVSVEPLPEADDVVRSLTAPADGEDVTESPSSLRLVLGSGDVVTNAHELGICCVLGYVSHQLPLLFIFLR